MNKSKLGLDFAQVAVAKQLAKSIADQVQQFVDGYTTVTVERTLCRLIGIDGIDENGVPLPNVVVDSLLEKGVLNQGVLYFIGNAILETGKDPQAIAEAVMNGQLDLTTLKLHHITEIQNAVQPYIDTLYTIPKELLDKRIDKITPDDIQDAINTIEYMISSNASLKAYDIINSALKNAVNNDKIRKNPCISIDRPHYNPKEKEIYTTEEVMRMYRAIRYIRSNGTYHSIKHDYFTLFMFLLFTGTRINEALGARWEDITWTEGKEEIYIQRTIDSHAPHQTARTPKTTAGRRHIPLSKRLLRRLKKLRPNGEESKGYIFATATGNALGYHNAWKTWDAIGRECARECPSCHEKRPNGWTCSHGHHVNRRGLKCRECGEERPEEWTCPTCGTLVREIHKSFHSTRHTFCSFLVNAGVPITTVQYLAGHASSTVTLDTYSHKAENYRDVLEEKLYGTKEPDTKQ